MRVDVKVERGRKEKRGGWCKCREGGEMRNGVKFNRRKRKGERCKSREGGEYSLRFKSGEGWVSEEQAVGRKKKRNSKECFYEEDFFFHKSLS